MNLRRRNFAACLLILSWLGVSPEGTVSAATATAVRNSRVQALAYHRQLAESILPYWHDTALDLTNGGYVLADDGKGGHQAREKQLVSQARLVWTFSHVHQRGFSRPGRDYLKAAEHGYRFLQQRFLDPLHGGYYWKTDLAGNPSDPRKILYGQAFVLYALVEYYRASGDKEPLRQAMTLYQVLQQRAHDGTNSGWFEHFTRDWQVITRSEPGLEVEVAGLKSANAHLHLMEALTELYDVTREAGVRQSLREALRINATYFYPKNPGNSSFHRHPDWSEVADPRSAGLSYGHNVEFAWLMVRAQRVLKARVAWDHFDAHLRHALRYGFDHARGGLYNRGADDQPATQLDKVWWVQAELIAALADALQRRSDANYSRALNLTLDFVNKYQADPKDGVWYDTVAADGSVKVAAKAHNWKANYHDVRALVKYIETFAPTAFAKHP